MAGMAAQALINLKADTTIEEMDGYVPIHGAGFQARGPPPSPRQRHGSVTRPRRLRMARIGAVSAGLAPSAGPGGDRQNADQGKPRV
jgi:hypothetical protein